MKQFSAFFLSLSLKSETVCVIFYGFDFNLVMELVYIELRKENKGRLGEYGKANGRHDGTVQSRTMHG